MNKKNFALIGAAGYIAPRHMKAIAETGNLLTTAYDPYDGVGIMDSYFPNADFFTEFERFDRHVNRLSDSPNAIDYVSICSPNYLHDSHIRFGLRSNSNVICEKPIVLNPWNVEALEEEERKFDSKVYTILQLRHHKAILELKEMVQNGPRQKIYDIDLTYLTSRGNWYFSSWKGNLDKSGGIATNIGVHFFDMLTWIFGSVKTQQIHIHSFDRAAGYMELEKARVRWFLSIDYNLIPEKEKMQGKRTYRSIMVDGREVEFSQGFTDLHTDSYNAILNEQGYRIGDAKDAIQIVHDIREGRPIGLHGDYHPLAKHTQNKHPHRIYEAS